MTKQAVLEKINVLFHPDKLDNGISEQIIMFLKNDPRFVLLPYTFVENNEIRCEQVTSGQILGEQVVAGHLFHLIKKIDRNQKLRLIKQEFPNLLVFSLFPLDHKSDIMAHVHNKISFFMMDVTTNDRDQLIRAINQSASCAAVIDTLDVQKGFTNEIASVLEFLDTTAKSGSTGVFTWK